MDPKWKKGDASWLSIVPWGLRRLLRWIKERYVTCVCMYTYMCVGPRWGHTDRSVYVVGTGIVAGGFPFVVVVVAPFVRPPLPPPQNPSDR
jgi:hypothetical protein